MRRPREPAYGTELCQCPRPLALSVCDETERLNRLAPGHERNWRGVQERNPEWLVLARGMHRERRDSDGLLVGDATDEVPQRAIWRQWRKLMEAE